MTENSLNQDLNNQGQKFYIVDTNILMHYVNWTEFLKDGIIVLSTTVIGEIDKHKHDFGTNGVNSRTAARLLGRISDGLKESQVVTLEEGTFMIVNPNTTNYDFLENDVNDDKIISVAFNIRSSFDKTDIIVVSNDINVRSKVLIQYHAHKIDAIKLSEEIDVSAVQDLYNEYKYSIDDGGVVEKLFHDNLTVAELDKELLPNTSLSINHKGDVMLARVDCFGKVVKFINRDKILGSFGKRRGSTIKPINDQQILMSDLIRNSGMKIVSINGVVGSGKTLNMVSNMMMEIEAGKYTSAIIMKPLQEIGKTVGFLKGEWSDKVAPIKASYESAFMQLGYDINLLEEQGIIRFTTGEYERGMTYGATGPQIVLVDETQNYQSLSDLKALITRCAENSMIILASDNRQVDSQRLNETNNPASLVMQRLQGQPFYACIHLGTSVRASHLNIVDNLL